MPLDDEKQIDDAKGALKANRFAHLLEDRGGNRRNGRRASPLYVWMWDNYDALVEARQFRPDWAAYLTEAAGDGVAQTTTGRDLTPVHAKVVWMRVRRAKRAIEERTKENPAKIATSRASLPPSRVTGDWTPPMAGPSVGAEKKSSPPATVARDPVSLTTSSSQPLSFEERRERGREGAKKLMEEVRKSHERRQPGFLKE